MQLHTLIRKTKNKTKKIIGRGGKRGTYSGRGQKGQKSRAGRKIRPEFRDLLKKIPKLRGRGTHSLKSVRNKKEVTNLVDISNLFSDGEVVTPQSLFEKKLIRKQNGKLPKVKILGNGSLTKKVLFNGCDVSKVAQEKINKAGAEIAK